MLSKLDSIKQSVISKFLGAAGLGAAPVSLFGGSTEEVQHELQKGKPLARHNMQFAAGRLSMGGGAQKRLEENYLYDSRLFVSPIVANEYVFFANALGAPAANNGFTVVAGMTMSEVETNMDTPSAIAQGKNFVMTQVGVSFNANAITADVALMLEVGALRFTKQGGQFTLKHGPIRFWPGGTGVSGYAGTTAATPTVATHNGDANIGAVRKLSVPRVLKAKDTFSYVYVVPRSVTPVDGVTALTLTAATVMTVWLWGAQQDNIPV